MRKHLRYLGYVLRHKWRVFWIGRALGVPVVRLLKHDLSKFSPTEWEPYAEWFYGGHVGMSWSQIRDLVKQAGVGDIIPQTGVLYRYVKGNFDEAWSHHWQHNEHHWEHWARGLNSPAEMPESYAREMVADWTAAGMDKGMADVLDWYPKNRDRIRLHPNTRVLVEQLLGIPGDQNVYTQAP